ncbi:MAG TPA: hypothetical protein VKY73_19425, partial [Polyangiaceae bacterium]|nr:hypothetical protein [Polyangiaceae bacterium]
MNRWTLRATGYGALAAALSIAGLSIAGQATQQSPSQSPSPGRTGPGSGQMGPGPHHGPHGQQGPHGQRVFDYFDRDKSGDVTRAEVQSVALEHFTRIDTNDDNLVSKAELMDHARQSRPGGPTGETLDARAERGLNIVFQLGDADD